MLRSLVSVRLLLPTQESVYLDTIAETPVLAELGWIKPEKWRDAMMQYRIGVTGKWQATRPTIPMDSPLMVEIWLRTVWPRLCLKDITT